MEVANHRTDLLRVLLADDDDVNAFVLQCAINRLSQPSAFQRIGRRDLLADKIETFHPQFLVAAGTFTTPGELKQIKQLTNGHPIICLVETRAQAEASLAAGAADCVLLAQKHELGACLERHLTGTAREPHFRAAEVSTLPRAISKMETRLEDFDRRAGAFLRKLATTTQREFRDLKRGLDRACRRLRDQALQRCKELKVKRLLHKQREPMHSPVSSRAAELPPPRFTAPALASALASRMEGGLTARESVDSTDSILAAQRDEPNDALRTLELSFKTLFHTGLDPMFLLDGLGVFLHVNPAGCALLGSVPAELLGKSLLDFVSAGEKPNLSALWEAFLIEGQQKGEIHLQTTRGEERDVFVSARANLWFGVHLLILRDQTELKKLQSELTTLRPVP